MRVLVTGGAGFIGSHTVEALLATGATVRVLDNFSSGRRENLSMHARLEVVDGDIRDSACVAACMADVTHVLHLAGQVSVAASIADPLISQSHNITGFVNVLDAARRAGASRFVYASSAAVYGAPEHLPLAENSPTQPISPYGLEKLVNDQYANLFCRLYGYSTLGMRYFNVYGPRQDPHSFYSGVITIFCERMRKGEPLDIYGDGQQTRDFIFVGDVARANLVALAGSATGVCNIATGETHSILDIKDILSEVAGKHPEVNFMTQRTGDIPDSSADITRLRTTLGIDAFTPLTAGINRLWSTLA